MSELALPEDWQDWVITNVERNCDQEEMLNILIQNGFSASAAKAAITAACQRLNDYKPLFIPNAQQVETEKAELYSVESFLSAAECTELIQLIRSSLRPSTTTNERGKFKNYRTSRTCDLSLLNSTFITEIDRRICKMLGIANSYSEGIQGQWYDVGEEFKAHTDYFEPDSPEYQEHAADRGQRTWTFMIYLNTVKAGGDTFFPQLGLRFQPLQGRAVIWNNLDQHQLPNPDTLHHGEPVESGYKAIITKWFRTHGDAELAIDREENENFPCHTQVGFLKSIIPEALFHQLLVFHKTHLDSQTTESVPGFIHSAQGKASSLIQLSDELRAEIHQTLQPIAEAWSGKLLNPTYVYGIREYHRGAILEPHRDRLNTHEVSLILNLRQQVEQDWPLLIEDHFYRQHRILLKPGQMLLYEGCRLLHGRPEPLIGDSFSNIFVHFAVAS